MRIVLACLVSLVCALGTADAGTADHFRPGQRRESAALGGRAWVLPDDGEATPASAHNGKIIVRNRSGLDANIYLAPDDGVTDLIFVDTLPTGFKLIIRSVPRRQPYVLYAEDVGEQGSWGPRQFFLKRKYRWTLLR